MAVLADLHDAIRTLVRYATFSAVAVITLALGIGANTAVFTLVDGVLVVVALVATWIPAARAAGVDPARALRAD